MLLKQRHLAKQVTKQARQVHAGLAALDDPASSTDHIQKLLQLELLAA